MRYGAYDFLVTELDGTPRRDVDPAVLFVFEIDKVPGDFAENFASHADGWLWPTSMGYDRWNPDTFYKRSFGFWMHEDGLMRQVEVKRLFD